MRCPKGKYPIGFEVASIIKRKMRLMIVDGIKYEKIGDDEFYA